MDFVLVVVVFGVFFLGVVFAEGAQQDMRVLVIADALLLLGLQLFVE